MSLTAEPVAPRPVQPELPPAPGLPRVLIVSTPPALARSMVHGLQRAWAEHQALQCSSTLTAWPSLVPPSMEPGDPDEGTSNAVITQADAIYLLGLDWRDLTSMDHTAAQAQLTRQAQWRSHWQALGQPFVVLYGTPARQWSQLVDSLKMIATPNCLDWLKAENPLQSRSRLRARSSDCEQCGDPDCERRLFDALRQDEKPV